MFKGDTPEIENIEKTIQLYDEAFNEWNLRKLVRAFHPDSMVYWFIPEQNRFYNGLCYRWVEDFLHNELDNPGLNFYVNVESIYQHGTAAYARVRFLIDDPEGPRDTTDYLTLMKFDSDWRIVNKSGHTMDVSVEDLKDRIANNTEIPNNVPEEINEIKGVLQAYSVAFNELDCQKIKDVFHPSMRMNSICSETMKFKNQFRPFAVWKEGFEEHKEKGITFETEVKHIDQRGTAAVAVMYWKALTPDGEKHTTDFLTMLKVENKWLIVNKTCCFGLYEEQAS